MTLKPTQVLLSVDSKGGILEYGISATTPVLTLMCNTATAAVGPIAVANNTFVYVLDQSKSPAQIFGFVIAHGNSGALAAITGSPFTLSEALPGNASLVADPLGRFMFVTNNSTGSGDVHVLTIGQSGALTEATGSPFPVSAPDFIAINPAGTFAFVPDSTDGDIFIFSLNNNGRLTATAASPFVIGMGNNAPHFAIVHPNGNFLLTANEITLGSFSIDNTGALTQVGGSPFSPGGAGDAQVAPLAITLDMSGKFLYVTPLGTSTTNPGIPGFQSENIVGFAFDTTGGGLTPVPMSPFISTSTLDLIADPMVERLFFVTSNTTAVLFDVAPIDASGNLTLPTTGLTVTAVVHPVVVNIN
jgi:6-phosphogluconolactonase (cycloisomerase 2 family)